jgi:prepilin-type processing-associated H-X9-DG protein/prepilin-type N-terminal cleavage/methylation domain-containing protein
MDRTPNAFSCAPLPGRNHSRSIPAASLRRGLTIVELLVVIAVIGILVGTLMPALQMARESSRRSACSNNLRQIAFAMVNYVDARKYLPGWRNSIKTYSTVRAHSAPADAAVSWTIPILPHLEQSAVYQWYGSYSADPSADTSPPPAHIDTYRCPSHGKATTPSPLSYAVNAGTGGEVINEDSAPAAQYVADGVFPDAVGNIPSEPLFDATRRSYSAARSSMKDIAPDGTTATVMLSERSGPSVPQDISWAMNPRVAKENRGAISRNHAILQPLPIGSGARTQIRVINPTADTRPLPSPVPGNANLDDWNVRYPSSHHPGAVNAAFCDGHVRVLRDGIDAWVYCQLLSSAGNSASAGVRDWQRAFNDAGTLVPYTFNPADLIR